MKNEQDYEGRLIRLNGEDFNEGLKFVNLYYIPFDIADHFIDYINNGVLNYQIEDILQSFYLKIGGFPYVIAQEEKKLSFEELNKFWRNQLISEYIKSHYKQIKPYFEINMELR